MVAHFRAVFWGCDELTEDEVLRAVAERLGYQRLGPRRRKELKRHLRTAIRRQAVARDGNLLTCPTSIFRNYENDFLLDRLRSVMRPGREYERTEVARNLAHYLGYRSVSKGMQKQLKSLFNSAIRRDVIQSQGKHIWRES